MCWWPRIQSGAWTLAARYQDWQMEKQVAAYMERLEKLNPKARPELEKSAQSLQAWLKERGKTLTVVMLPVRRSLMPP